MAVEETEGSGVRISPSPFAEVTKGKKLMLKTSEETEAYQTYLENRILNKNELYILNQNIKTSEAIQEIVWKKQTCKCESVYENLEPKRPTLWKFRGPAATRGGKSFG